MVLGSVVLVATAAQGQTLFARPDTTPNYASYRDIEECKNAIARITEAAEGRGKKIWWDTAGVALRKTVEGRQIDGNGRQKGLLATPRPDAAIKAGQACLARFNADTANFINIEYTAVILEALLMAHRDDDARRFAERYLDSMRARSATMYKDQLQWILEKYTAARPIRYAEAKQYHAKILATVAGDSLYRTIEADMQLALAAEIMNDTAYLDELAWHAIHTNDSVPVAARTVGKNASTRLGWMEEMFGKFTQNEGFDSLAISNVAYNLYKANTVKRRVYGGELVNATDSRVQPIKVADLVGEYYYTSTTGGSYTKHGAVPPGTLPVKGRVNYITSWPSFCHAEGLTRPTVEIAQIGNSGRSCAGTYNMMRIAKELHPDVEIIVLSDTYGTVGQLGPLEPADEADTLAKLFLGHGRVPAHLVVEHTPLFNVEAPDGRRIDLPTPQRELLGHPRTVYDNFGGVRWLVDKDGYLIKASGFGFGAGAGSGDFSDRMLTILKNRPSKP